MVFDFGDWLESELAELARLAAELSGAPVIALVGFPRVEDRDQILAAGASAVLSKPVLVDDVLWQLDAVLRDGGLSPLRKG